MSSSNVYLPGTIQIPSSLQITAITNAYPAVATVSVDEDTAVNTWKAGMLVNLFIPFGYGMQQANGQTYEILDRTGNSITLNLNSVSFDAFSVPVSGEMPATMTPSGSRNLAYSNSTNLIAYQSYDNTGN